MNITIILGVVFVILGCSQIYLGAKSIYQKHYWDRMDEVNKEYEDQQKKYKKILADYTNFTNNHQP